MAKRPEQILDKFRRNVAGAGADYNQGVENPKRGWLEGYVKAADRMEQATIRALQEGRHVRGAQRTGEEGWADAARTVGSRRYTEAAGRAAQGYAGVVQDVIAAGEAARQAANALPDITMEQRIARAAAGMTAVSNYWKRKRGGG